MVDFFNINISLYNYWVSWVILQNQNCIQHANDETIYTKKFNIYRDPKLH